LSNTFRNKIIIFSQDMYLVSRQELILDRDSNITIDWIQTQISYFVEHEHYSSLIFPPSLTSYHRKQIHILGKNYNLVSKSIGQRGNFRFMLLHKRTLSKQEQSDRENKMYYMIPFGMSVIFPTFLYLGSGLDARSLHSLNKERITCVLNCAKEWENVVEDYSTQIEYVFLDMKQKPTEDEDTEEFLANLYQAIDLIDTWRKNSKKNSCSLRIGEF